MERPRNHNPQREQGPELPGIPSSTRFEVASFGYHPNPKRKQGNDLRRFGGVRVQSLVQASGYDQHQLQKTALECELPEDC